jgi:hypothetical protein
MEKKELTFYWYPTNDSDGVNFETDKEYTIEKITSILQEYKKNKINGFFIHYGESFLSFLSQDRKEFHRIIIKSEEDGQFSEETKIFSIPDFKFIEDFKKIYSKLPNSYPAESKINFKKGTSMLGRFGLFDIKTDENN